jgi:hypothetical protein
MLSHQQVYDFLTIDIHLNARNAQQCTVLLLPLYNESLYITYHSDAQKLASSCVWNRQTYELPSNELTYLNQVLTSLY